MWSPAAFFMWFFITPQCISPIINKWQCFLVECKCNFFCGCTRFPLHVGLHWGRSVHKPSMAQSNQDIFSTYACQRKKKKSVSRRGQNSKIGTYKLVRAVSWWWNKTSFTSYVVHVSASLNMLTDRTSFLMLLKVWYILGLRCHIHFQTSPPKQLFLQRLYCWTWFKKHMVCFN